MARAVALNLLKALAARRGRSPQRSAVWAGSSAGRRRRSCSRSARCSPRRASTATATARCSGCSERGRSRSPRIRSCARRRTRSPRSSACARRSSTSSTTASRGSSPSGAGRTSSTLAVSVGALQIAPPRGARGRDRARARARPPARRARPDVRRPLRDDARRDRAGSAAGSRASSSTSSPRSARRSSTSCSRPSASCTPTRSQRRRPEPAHDLADALMRLDRAAELVEFAASPATEPLYPIDPFETEGIARMFKTHPPLDDRVRRLRELGAGQNGRVPDVVTLRSSPGSSENITESRMRPSGWRRCARSTPSRWKPTFSATRCEARLSGSVIELDALELELLERVPARGVAARACRFPGRALGAATQYPMRPAVVVRVEAHADPADDASVELDRQRVVVRPHLAADERERVARPCTDAGSSGSSARSRGRCSPRPSRRRRPPSTAAARDRRRGAPCERV